MASIFSKIIRGEIPCHRVAENERCFAFLDIRPIVFGHTLVVPKEEIDYYFDLPDDYIAELNTFAKKVATVLRQEVPCIRIGVMVAGLEVPHAHMHLIPINNMSDMNFANKKLKLSPEEFKKIQERIVKEL